LDLFEVVNANQEIVFQATVLEIFCGQEIFLLVLSLVVNVSQETFLEICHMVSENQGIFYKAENVSDAQENEVFGMEAI